MRRISGFEGWIGVVLESKVFRLGCWSLLTGKDITWLVFEASGSWLKENNPDGYRVCVTDEFPSWSLTVRLVLKCGKHIRPLLEFGGCSSALFLWIRVLLFNNKRRWDMSLTWKRIPVLCLNASTTLAYMAWHSMAWTWTVSKGGAFLVSEEFQNILRTISLETGAENRCWHHHRVLTMNCFYKSSCCCLCRLVSRVENWIAR